MVTVSIKMYGRSEKCKEIIQTIKGISDQLQQDTNCLDANIYKDLNDENVFYLVEEWESEQELEAHLNSRMFAVLLGAGILLVKPPQVKCMVENGPESCSSQKMVQLLLNMKQKLGVNEEKS